MPTTRTPYSVTVATVAGLTDRIAVYATSPYEALTIAQQQGYRTEKRVWEIDPDRIGLFATVIR